MEQIFDQDEEMTMTEEQAQRLVEWVTKQGLSKEKAYEALAYVMNATPEQHE